MQKASHYYLLFNLHVEQLHHNNHQTNDSHSESKSNTQNITAASIAEWLRCYLTFVRIAAAMYRARAIVSRVM